MNVILFEDDGYRDLLPLTWVRPAFDLRRGRRTLVEFLRHNGRRIVAFRVRRELAAVVGERYPVDSPQAGAHYTFLNSRLDTGGSTDVPEPGCAWWRDDRLLAATLPAPFDFQSVDADTFLDPTRLRHWSRALLAAPPPPAFQLLRYPWSLIEALGRTLADDCREPGLPRILESRVAARLAGVHLVDEGEIRVADGVTIKPGAVLDAESGPIAIDRDARIEPGAVIQGPCYVGMDSIVRPGALLRGHVSIGPMCRVGGELEACIFQGYSNKQHDGFMGHSFVAPWVNVGAGTITSDLKNTYSRIRVNLCGRMVDSGSMFVGTTFGDHAKTGIGTILPTGCVLGVACNVFTQGRVPGCVPSFGWLTGDGLSAAEPEKMVEIATTVQARRKVAMSAAEAELLRSIATRARAEEGAAWPGVS